MTDNGFVSTFPPLRGELEKIREYEKAVAEEKRRILAARIRAARSVLQWRGRR